MIPGKFISIEGTEGAGKSTALSFIQQLLTKAHIDVVMTREPGGTPLSEDIRQLLLHTQREEKILAETELLLLFAGRAQHLHHGILPALQSGKWVVSDRFIDASYAYQSGGRGFDIEKITYLDKWIVGNHYPDLTLLLDIDARLGMSRTEKRGAQKDRIEQEKIDFFMRVREMYLARAKHDTVRIKVIDASQPLTEVQAAIQVILDDFIKRSLL